MRKGIIAFALASLCLAGLVACDTNVTPEDKTNVYVLPDDLKDCKISTIKSKFENDLTITRCPLSATTTTYDESCGKNCTRTVNNAVVDEKPEPPKPKDQYVTIDGVKYKLTKE